MKRIISFLLVAVMAIAMIPAVMINSSAADVVSYASTVTSEKIELDCVLDEPYKNGQSISSTHWGTGNSSGLNFTAYTAVTFRGVYVWAEIKDNSLNKSTSHPADMGDKFQIYIRMSDGKTDAWGWYDADYNGKTSKGVKAGPLANAETVTSKLSDGSGWRCETFIPFEGVLDPMYADVGAYKLYIGLQANNAVYNPNTNSNTYTAYCYDKDPSKAQYYNKYDLFSPLNLFVENDAVTKTSLEKTAVYVKSSPTLDGVKDAAYSDHAKIELSYVTKDGTYTGSESRANMGTAYVAFTGYNLYIYYETEDKDLAEQDFLQVYYMFENDPKPISGYFCAKIDPAGNHFYGSNGQAWGYPGISIENSTNKVTSVAKALGNDKYSIEFKIPLTTAVKIAMKDGSAKIKLDFSASDYATDGSRKFFGGCTSYSASMYNYNVFGDKFTGVVLSKNFTDETPGTITGANVDLGSDITVNYYAAVSAKDVFNSCMRFTKNGETYIAYPEKADYTGEYKFAYKGVAPQTIGDNIKAELIIDGAIVATHDNYSVLENVLNIYNNEAYAASTYNNMKMLIKGLLNYGAAAQKYASYETDSLVSEGYEISLSSPSANVSVRDTGTPISSNLKFDALGVYFDSTNRIYAKLTATSLAGVKVTINGHPATIEKVEGETNRYIVYSAPIPVTHFGSVYRFVLSNGSKTQTLTYSVNSYTYQKYNSETPKVAELAKATYTYGELARKYANLGTSSYKIMTVNDGDTGYYNRKNYQYVAQIINTYAPDVVGLQEVQKNDALTNYPSKLSDYGVVYYKHGYPNTTVENGLAEKNNEYGNVILYRKDRFNLLESGRRWLSHTPDTASRVEGSDWTRSYCWAKLQDKRTGEVIVAVNTHIDYMGAQYDSNGNFLYNPRLEQIKILMSLTKAQFGDLPTFYVADWNFGPGSDAYEYVNSLGYYATETMLKNPNKPSSTIDCCFVDPDVFTALDYKYINHFDFGTPVDFHTQVTDHPMVYTEIVFVDIAPEASLGETIDGPFNTPDDNEGF